MIVLIPQLNATRTRYLGTDLVVVHQVKSLSLTFQDPLCPESYPR